MLGRSIRAFAAVLLAGCYTFEPVSGPTPAVGSELAFDITDAGRVALGGAMGPEIGQVEGRLVQQDTSEYVVAVTSVHLLRGGEQTWSGEAIHLKSAYVGRVYERKYSKSRTIALAAVGVGIAAAIATRSIVGAGDVGQQPPPDSSGQTTRRKP